MQRVLGDVLAGLSRKTLHVSPSASLLSAIASLRSNKYQIIVIDGDLSKARYSRESLVTSGYSIISKLLETKPLNYGELLASRCVDSALVAGSIDEGSDLVSLLHVFETTTFGFAMLHNDKQADPDIISVRDLLTLYETKVLSTKLTLNDVKSAPVVSMSRGSKLFDVIHEMLRWKIRRILVVGTRMVVSDTLILAYLFGESRMKRIIKSPERLVDGSLEDIEMNEVPWIDGNTSIKHAASFLNQKKVDCALTDHGMITSWDLIVKPWRLGELITS